MSPNSARTELRYRVAVNIRDDGYTSYCSPLFMLNTCRVYRDFLDDIGVHDHWIEVRGSDNKTWTRLPNEKIAI